MGYALLVKWFKPVLPKKARVFVQEEEEEEEDITSFQPHQAD